MKKIQKYAIISLILVFLFNISLPSLFAAEENGDPVITSVIMDKPELSGKPHVIGLCPENSEVMIYLNGNYEGNAEINRENTGTDNFFYQIVKDLPAGEYTVSAIAKNKTSLRLSNISNDFIFSIKPLSAPTLIQPNEKTITGKVKPFITGLTVNNTIVHLYIDGVYNGKTELLNHVSGTANFKYIPFLNLAPGWHKAYARAEDKNGNLSGISNELNFRIEDPNPAPTVLAAVLNSKTNKNQPLITGVVKNNSKVRIFIDKKLNGEFLVINHPSGTAHFSYKPFLALTSGKHMVYATALDSRGKESVWSKILYFDVADGIDASIGDKNESDVVKIEDRNIPEAKVGTETKEPEDSKKNDEKSVEEKKQEINPELKDILNTENNSTSTDKSGLINESKEQQGKLKLNLVIFIIFLFMVIAWIFWVNRELIKERRDQNEKDKTE